MAMLYYWTKECESGITELRYERRAIQNTKARFQANIAKIPTALARNSFRNLEEQMMPLHRLRLETLFTVSWFSYLLTFPTYFSTKILRIHNLTDVIEE